MSSSLLKGLSLALIGMFAWRTIGASEPGGDIIEGYFLGAIQPHTICGRKLWKLPHQGDEMVFEAVSIGTQ